MADIVPIIKVGNPVLKQVAEPVAADRFGSPELRSFTDLMFRTMRAEPGVGLAAPQIGVSERIVVFSVSPEDPRLEPGRVVPDTVLINPVIDQYSDEIVIDYESCLSVGEMCALVPRAKHIAYSGFDLNGNPVTGKASGFEARLIQHEYDHLNGIVFLERVEDKKSFILKEELLRLRKDERR